MVDRLVLVIQRTELEALAEYQGDILQARFLLAENGEDLDEVNTRHDAYMNAQQSVQKALPAGFEVAMVERQALPDFEFDNHDAVVTLGSDGLVVNTAQYLTTQPLLGLHADPEKTEPDVCACNWQYFPELLPRLLRNEVVTRQITMAEAWLSSGERKRAVGDLFIGRSNHASARYRIRYRGQTETQLSSGMVVATGLGSTGWIRSVLAGARALTAQVDRRQRPENREAFAWHREELAFAVREPYLAGIYSANTTYGKLSGDEGLEIDSLMLDSGVIYADGMYDDAAEFATGTTAQIYVLPEQLKLVVG